MRFLSVGAHYAIVAHFPAASGKACGEFNAERGALRYIKEYLIYKCQGEL